MILSVYETNVIMKRICNEQNIISLNKTPKPNLLQQKQTIFTNTLDKSCSFYSKLLHQYVEKQSKKEGKVVHGCVITNRLFSNPFIGTKLVIFYSKIGDMVSCRKVFDQMTEGSMVTYTALLSGYTQNGYPKEAFFVFLNMRSICVKDYQFTYGSVIRACTDMECLNSGKQVHACVEKSWFVSNLFVQSALVNFYSKCGDMEDACCVFKAMSERDLVCWNTMLGCYAVHGCANEAFRLFSSMLREGVIPDSFTFGSAIKASTEARSLTKLIQIHGIIIKLGFEQHNVSGGSLVDAYVKCGNLRFAACVYMSMRKRDIVSCTALITGYAREGIYSLDVFMYRKRKVDVCYLFNEIHQMHMVDNIIICSMLSICAKRALWDMGKVIHGLALTCLPNHDTALGNALIDMYSKGGDIENAKHVFDMMGKRNVISWTSLIGGYGKNGFWDEAYELFGQMISEGFKPNDITFLNLFFACSHSGLNIKGLDCFVKMVKEYKIVPRPEHYSCLVDLFSRGGRLKEAYGLIGKMDIKANTVLLGSILSACEVYGDPSLGEIVGSQLIHIEPEMSVHYVALGRIYAAAGMWDNVSKIIKEMEDKNLKKDPGYSLLRNRYQSQWNFQCSQVQNDKLDLCPIETSSRVGLELCNIDKIYGYSDRMSPSCNLRPNVVMKPLLRDKII